MVEHDILHDNPQYPKSWQVAKIGQERKLLCGRCVEALLLALNGQQERVPVVGAGGES